MKAIVTGASSGIGRAIALKLAAAGWQLAVISRSEKRVDELMALLGTLGMQEHIFMTGDLTHPGVVESFCSTVQERWGNVDLIVNNAGEYVPGDVGTLTLTQLDEQMNVNFRCGFKLIQHFVPVMKQAGKGRIVFISSQVVNDPRPFAAAYTLSKSLNDMYARLLRDELRESGIGVTRIVPGSVNTPTWGDAEVPRDQFVQPEEIAQLVFDICSMSASTLVDEIRIRPLDKNW
jgi:3-oxoacyl-[acyl-carrier protein] reductase